MCKNYYVLIIDFVLFNKKINSVIILAEALYITPARVKLFYSIMLFKRLSALFLRPIASYWFIKTP
jgi:hypothetical protein